MFRISVLVAVLVGLFSSSVSAQGKTPDDVVLASGADFKITVKDFREHMTRFGPLMQHKHLDADTVRTLLDDMINTAVFAAHAKENGLDKNDAVEHQVRELAVRELLLKNKAKNDVVSDAEIKKYFNEHPDRFLQGELRRASVILLKEKAKAEAIHKKALKADTKAFAALARDNSINPQTRIRGGDLRYFNRDGIPLQLLHLYAAAPSQAPKTSNIDPAIAKAAFELDSIGSLSAVIPVGENFAIVRLTGKREPQYKTWQDAKEPIRAQLMQERSRAGSEQLVDSLRKKHTVKVTPKPLETYIFKEAPREPAATKSPPKERP